MTGRASLPLAAANPEVRRSKTELFDRPGSDPLADRPPARPRGSSNLVLFGGVAVVLVAGALVFYLKQKPAPAGAAITPASVSPAAPVVTDPKVDLKTGPKADPGGAARGEGTVVVGGGATAGATKVGASAAEATSEGDPKADGKKKTGSSRRHRSSREAIESLGVPEGGAEPAPAHEQHEGTQTPAELKNPFQPQPQP
jgi:hypothetical protein